MTPTAIDCQSFAGGFSLGMVQAGFELIAKREYPGGFGSPAMEGNRHLLGDKWKLEASDPAEWTPLKTDVVFGNPPCSGFSNRSVMVRGILQDGTYGSLDIRGADSAINDCMWSLIQYAAECDPKIVVFESVQGAYKKGHDLMKDLRRELNELTGDTWTLYHVLHNVHDLGGAQLRARYFWVAARIPFGIDPIFNNNETVYDRIGDLEDVPLGSIEGHDISETPRSRRVAELATKATWHQGELSGHAYERAINEGIELELWNDRLTSDKGMTQFAPKRLRYNAPSLVLAGDAPTIVIHPTLPRPLTHREIARLTGFPDDWKCAPYQEKLNNGCWWGKGITIEAAAWISKAVFDAVAGSPQQFQGEQIGEEEFLIKANDPESLNQDQPLFNLKETAA